MSDKTRYSQIFCDVFEVENNSLQSNPGYQEIEGWDSVGHMSLMASIEDAFTIELDIDDIIDFSSYESGWVILQKYGLTES